MRKFAINLGVVLVNMITALMVAFFLFSDEIDHILDRNWQIYYADKDPEMAVFGPKGCGDPCVITFLKGGVAQPFINMAVLIKMYGRQLIVDGPCASGCGVMADFARPLVCITPRASFYFHMGTTVGGERVLPPVSDDIAWWIQQHGGFPYGKPLEMTFTDAQIFWPVCGASSKEDRLART